MPNKCRSPEVGLQAKNRSVLKLSLAAGLLLALGQPVAAQEAIGAPAPEGKRALVLLPRMSVTMTATDNLTLDTSAKDVALVTVLAPGINLVSNHARATGTLDYSISSLLYTKTNQPTRHQSALTAQLALEPVENWLFIDSRASIGQQAISAFGPQTQDNQLVNANRTEVATLSVSPSVRGLLGDVATYDLGATFAETRAKDSALGDGRNGALSLRIASAGGQMRLLGWSLTANSQHNTQGLGRDTRSATAMAGLQYRPDPDLNFELSTGRERNDFQTSGQRSDTTYALRAAWSPTPRTKLSADWQRHAYGNSHTLNFEHRMARSVWRWLDTQSVMAGGAVGAAGLRSNYDLLFLQFASIEPDPVKRDTLVNTYLQNNGLSPNAIATTGFLTAGTNVTRRQEASMSWQGLRTTLTAMLSRTNTHRLDVQTPANDDLGQFGRIIQQGLSLTISHRLTLSSSLGLTASSQRTRADQAGQTSDLKSIVANWSGRLGARSTVQLGARASHFDATLKPYRENAVFANLVQQF